jgi:hypothetical protein
MKCDLLVFQAFAFEWVSSLPLRHGGTLLHVEELSRTPSATATDDVHITGMGSDSVLPKVGLQVEFSLPVACRKRLVSTLEL